MKRVLYGVIIIGVVGDIWGIFHLHGLLEARKAERKSASSSQVFPIKSSTQVRASQ